MGNNSELPFRGSLFLPSQNHHMQDVTRNHEDTFWPTQYLSFEVNHFHIWEAKIKNQPVVPNLLISYDFCTETLTDFGSTMAAPIVTSVHAYMLSRSVFETLWTVASRAPLSMGFSRRMIHVTRLPRREGNGTPLQYSCLGNPMDEGAQ